jgi:hypothetical protein
MAIRKHQATLREIVEARERAGARSASLPRKDEAGQVRPDDRPAVDDGKQPGRSASIH